MLTCSIVYSDTWKNVISSYSSEIFLGKKPAKPLPPVNCKTVRYIILSKQSLFAKRNRNTDKMIAIRFTSYPALMNSFKLVLNSFFQGSKSALTQHEYLTSVVYILMHEVWQNNFAVSTEYITSNTDILGKLVWETLWTAFHFGIPFPSYVQTELSTVSILITLQVLIIFLSCF